MRLPSPLSSLNEEVSLFAESAKRQIRKIEEDGFRELRREVSLLFAQPYSLRLFTKSNLAEKKKKKKSAKKEKLVFSLLFLLP